MSVQDNSLPDFPSCPTSRSLCWFSAKMCFPLWKLQLLKTKAKSALRNAHGSSSELGNLAGCWATRQPPPNSLCQIPAGPLGNPCPASAFDLVSGVWVETSRDLVCASTEQPSSSGSRIIS